MKVDLCDDCNKIIMTLYRTENMLRTLDIGITYYNSEYTIPTGLTYVLEMKYPVTGEKSVNMTLHENKLSYTFTSDDTAKTGIIDCRIGIIDNDSKIYTQHFKIKVKEVIS